MNYDQIRMAAKAQLVERDKDFSEYAPEYPWEIVSAALAYVMDLPEEHLPSIRQHCDIFLGTSFPNQLFMYSGNIDAFEASQGYSWLGNRVEEKYWASEPQISCLNGAPLGLNIKDNTVNDVTCLLQRYACNMDRLGLQDSDHVVEIGAGYGGLAEALVKPRPNLRYTIIDLPETLFFSATFIKTHFPDASCYVYHPNDDVTSIDWEKYQFVFLPNYRAEWLRHLPRSQWAINTVSFPEMSRTQLCMYRDLLAETLDDILMSVNYFGGRDDGKGVSEFLSEKFAMTPTPEEIMGGLELPADQYQDLNCRPTMLFTQPDYDIGQLNGVTLRDVVFSKRVETVIGESVKYI